MISTSTPHNLDMLTHNNSIWAGAVVGSILGLGILVFGLWAWRSLIQRDGVRLDSLLSSSIASYFGRDMPCEKCRKISLEEGSHLHYHFQGLKDSAKSGCPICLVIESAVGEVLQVKDPSSAFAENPSRRTLAPVYRQSTIQLGQDRKDMVYTIFDHNGKRLIDKESDDALRYLRDLSTTFDLFRRRDGIFPAQDILSHRELESNPASEASFNILMNWLIPCVTKHVNCIQNDLPLPTRVIDVSSDDLVRLVSTCNKARYTILSHCWGKRGNLTTTSSTIPERQTCIDIWSMPPSFQDAVYVTRKLGIQYLWIDSICIIQDSDEDWMRESAKMGEYYQNAYLTISAIDSADSHQGFLTPRKKLPTAKLIADPNLYLRPSQLRKAEIFKNAALNSRAWALQERLLSTRIVHYSKSEMFWECSTCSTQESDVTEHRDRIDSGSLISSEGEDFKRILSQLANDHQTNPQEAMSTWHRLVTQYTRRKLTRPSDKLTAFSGLASTFQRISQYTYLAGIWKEDVSGLLWMVDYDSESKLTSGEPNTPNEYRAPSWSWASLDAPVKYHFDDENTIHSVHDMVVLAGTTSPASPDFFGQIVDGCIRLKARACNVEYRKPLWGDQRLVTICERGAQDDIGHGYLDIFPKWTVRDISKACLALWVMKRLEYNSSYHAPDQYLLNNSRDEVLYCLLVEEEESSSGIWKRIGIGKINKQHIASFEKPEAQFLVIS